MKNLKFVLFLAILFAFNFGFGQAGSSFEGTVKYKFFMEDPTGLSDEEIKAKIIQYEPMMGEHMVYMFKGNKMKSEINGPMIGSLITYYYGGDSMYIKSDMEQGLMTVGANEGWNYTYNSMEITPKAKEINGIECDLLTFSSDKYTWKYYYNTDYSLDAKNYEKYSSGFWNVALKETGSLPLQFEGKIAGSYIYMVADEIISQELEDSVFDLPTK